MVRSILLYASLFEADYRLSEKETVLLVVSMISVDILAHRKQECSKVKAAFGNAHWTMRRRVAGRTGSFATLGFGLSKIMGEPTTTLLSSSKETVYATGNICMALGQMIG